MRTARFLFLAVATTAALPATAAAETFCVKPATGCLEVNTFEPEQLQSALDTAASDGEASTVVLGARTYSNTGATAWSVNDVNATDPTTIVGAGRDQTVLTTSNAADVLHTDVATGITTIRDLTVRATPGVQHRGIVGPSSGGTGARGLTLESVDVLNPDQPAGVAADNVVSGGTLRWTGGSSVTGPGGTGVRYLDGVQGTIRDVSIDAGYGITTGGDTMGLLVDRVQIAADVTGVVATKNVTVRDSVIRLDAPNDLAPSGVDVQSGTATPTVRVTNTTIIGPPDDGNAATEEGVGLRASVNNPNTTTVELRRSIINGFRYALVRGQVGAGTMTVTTSRSAYDSGPGRVLSSGSGSLTQDALPPVFGFVSPIDLHLRHDSPLVDMGEPPAFAAPVGETDLDGNLREVGSATDVGAFEYQRRAPTVNATVPATAASGQAVDLVATASDADPGDTLTYTWDLGDGTSATGPVVRHAYPAGTRTWSVTVTDPTGQTASSSGTIDVAAATVPPVAVPPVATPPVPQPPPVLTSPAPRITAASLSRRRFRATQRGLALRFTLNRRARLAVRVERRRGTRYVAVGALKTTATLPAGRRRVAFAPKVKGRRLRPGSYRLVLSALVGRTRSAPARVTFVVTR